MITSLIINIYFQTHVAAENVEREFIKQRLPRIINNARVRFR